MKYVRVVQWSTKDGSVQVEMLRDDQETDRFEVSAECAALLAAALGSEAQKLEAQGASGQQFIRPTGMQTGKTDKNEPLLLMTLPNGTEIPLVFKPESLPVLIAELEKLQRVLQPDGQIRWH